MSTRHYLILDHSKDRYDWTREINSVLNPEYEWFGKWKPATVCVNLEHLHRRSLIVLESFLVALAVRCAITSDMPVKIFDCRKHGPIYVAIFDWFRYRYKNCMVDAPIEVVVPAKKPRARKAARP